jgi:hypothetical protein
LKVLRTRSGNSKLSIRLDALVLFYPSPYLLALLGGQSMRWYSLDVNTCEAGLKALMHHKHRVPQLSRAVLRG